MANLNSSIINGTLSINGQINLNGENIDVTKFIKDPYPGKNNTGAGIVNYKPFESSDWGTQFIRNTHNLVNSAASGSIVGYDNNGVIYAKTVSDDDWSVVNRKYADDNYVKQNPANDRFVYGKNVVGSTLQETVYYVDQGNFSQAGRIPCWIAPDTSHTLASVNNPVTAKVSTPVGEADIANKKYVDDELLKLPSLSGDNVFTGTNIFSSTESPYLQFTDGSGKTANLKASFSSTIDNLTVNLPNKSGTLLTDKDIDSSLSPSSTNPVQNKIIYSELAEKQDLYDNMVKAYDLKVEEENSYKLCIDIPNISTLDVGMIITVKATADWKYYSQPAKARIHDTINNTYSSYYEMCYPNGDSFMSNAANLNADIKYGDFLTFVYDKLTASDTTYKLICIRTSRSGWDSIYPVGSFYITTSKDSPAKLFGGYWERIVGRFLFGTKGTNDTGSGMTANNTSIFGSTADNYNNTVNKNSLTSIRVGDYGGEAYHLDTVDEMPSHSHSFDGWGSVAGNNGYISGASSKNITSSQSFSMKNAGLSKAHNNMPPYYGVYIWERKM